MAKEQIIECIYEPRLNTWYGGNIAVIDNEVIEILASSKSKAIKPPEKFILTLPPSEGEDLLYDFLSQNIHKEIAFMLTENDEDPGTKKITTIIFEKGDKNIIETFEGISYSLFPRTVQLIS